MRAIHFEKGWKEGLLQGRNMHLCLLPVAYNRHAYLPVHEHVIRPLLKLARKCYVYQLPEALTKPKADGNIFIREGERHRLDLTKEVIRGYEYSLWHGAVKSRGQTYFRGSIIMLADEVTKKQFASILKRCWTPTFLSSMYQARKGHTRAAMDACETHVRKGGIAFTLQNGIQDLQIFAPPRKLIELYDLALRICEVHPLHFSLYMGDTPLTQWPRWMSNAFSKANRMQPRMRQSWY